MCHDRTPLVPDWKRDLRETESRDSGFGQAPPTEVTCEPTATDSRASTCGVAKAEV